MKEVLEYYSKLDKILLLIFDNEDIAHQPKYIADNLADLAYTLQVGRKAMEERLGIIVTSQEELKNKLKNYLDGEQGIEQLYQGILNNESFATFKIDEGMEKAIETWIENRQYGRLLELWVKGLNVDWQMLYKDLSPEQKPRRISAPTYPFARERYWIDMISNYIKPQIINDNIIVPLNNNTNGHTLFCINPLGSHVLCYREIADTLKEDYAVYYTIT
jgi:acyl transferase domain-containing protein